MTGRARRTMHDEECPTANRHRRPGKAAVSCGPRHSYERDLGGA